MSYGNGCTFLIDPFPLSATTSTVCGVISSSSKTDIVLLLVEGRRVRGGVHETQ